MARVVTKILIAASGTGGHLFPALAVAQKLADCDIEWLGVSDRLEQNLVPAEYPLHLVTAKGLQGNPLQKLKNAILLFQSIFQTKAILKRRRIDLVFTTGGYIAAPAILAAKIQGIPVVLHESNVLPGKVTHLLGKYCDRLLIGFQASERYLSQADTLCLGTPVRDEFLTPQPHKLDIPDDRFVILVMGGSQGAVSINQLVRQCAPQWIAAGAFIVHLTGKNDPDVATFNDPYYLALPFSNRVAALLQRANFVISRSGASALTEFAVAKTPALLIPYPYAAEDHQTLNAQVFVEQGAGLFVKQQQLTVESMTSMVLDIMRSPEQLRVMSENAASFAIPDSADQIAGFLRTLFPST